MKQLFNFLLWIALYFVRLPIERVQIVRASRRQPVPYIHWVGGREPGQPRHAFRPIQFLPAVVLSEIVIILIAFNFSQFNAFAFGFTGNLVLVGLVMLPTIKQQTEKAK